MKENSNRKIKFEKMAGMLEIPEELLEMDKLSQKGLRLGFLLVIDKLASRYEMSAEDYAGTYLYSVVSSRFGYLSRGIPFRMKLGFWEKFKDNLGVTIPW